MPGSGERSLIRAWQTCFQPDAGWERCFIKGLAHNCWCAHDNGVRAYLASSCTSTMDLARALADQGDFPEMSWAASILQTRGRGQFNRPWDSVAGNLSATIRLPDTAAGAGALLPLAIGLTIADELKNRMPAPQLKWPNDILVGGKKAGGILVEERQGIIMAGIGLNVEATPGTGSNPEGYRIPACSLAQFGCTADAPQLWHSLVNRIGNTLVQTLENPNHLRDSVEQALAFKGETVTLVKGNGESSLVKISGIDAAGGLIISTSRGEETIWSGQILPRIIV